MPRDLATLIRSMSPGALQLFKRQIASLPEREKQRAFSRLSGIPELSDILGRAAPMTPTVAQPQRQVQPAQMLQQQKDIPFWQQALSTLTAPFRWAEEYVTQPFGAIVTSPWSPEVAGTEEMGWLEREQTEYGAWEAPWGVKGAVEFLPWLAVPSVLGVAGKVAGVGAKMAAAGGLLGKAAPAVKGAGMALKYSPYGLVEQAAGFALRPAGKLLARAVGKTVGKARVADPSKVWRALTKTERGVVAKELGLAGKTGQKAWSRLTVREKKAVSDAILRPTEKVVAPVTRKVTQEVVAKPKITSKLFPEGFDKATEGSVNKLNELAKVTKLRTKATEALRRPERAARIGRFKELRDKFVQQGLDEEHALNKAKEALAKEYPKAELDLAESIIRKGLEPEDFQRLLKATREAPYIGRQTGWTELNTSKALQDLFDEKILQRNQIILLERLFGSDLARTLLRKRTLGMKAGEAFIELANAPRAMLASCDISGLLRQGAILFTRHPIEGLKTVKPMLSSLFSDKRAELVDDIIRSRLGMDDLLNPSLSKQLDLTSLPSRIATKMGEREEPFMGQWIERIPIIGPLIKGSNRAYVTVLNDMRSRSALNVLNGWKRAGTKYGLNDVSDLNRLVNWASGRGTLPGFMKNQSGLAGAVLFAPKYIMSRVQMPTTVLPMVTKSPLVRREAWRTLLSFVGAGAGILTLAKLTGAADIELDPRSSDFGKLKVGETRLDIWSGYAQYMRFMGQLASGQRRTASGRIQGLTRNEVLLRFGRSKLSPAMGLLTDLMMGETYLGESLPPKSAKGVFGQMYQRMMPLAIQDMVDAAQEDGLYGGIVASTGLLGIGVVTYTDEVNRARDKAAKKEYGMDWEEVGRTYGRSAQLKLEQTSPELMEAEKEHEERFAVGTRTPMQRWHSDGQAIEDTYREAIDLAVKEYRATRDGRRFRDKVDAASNAKRQMFASRAKREEYQEIIAYYNQPLEPEKVAEMNPGDVARREYYKLMFPPDMYDEFGNYRFDLADQREQEFRQKYGQQALDYIEEYQGSRWLDKPAELKLLEDARDTLRPYWDIADRVWAMYPKGLRELSDQIIIMERTDPRRAKQVLRRYPMILRARELIARYKAQLRRANPIIDRAHRLFY